MTALPPPDSGESLWTVGRLAELTGVTVRTLHHYDDIGLLTPEHRSPSGYRLYSSADLERLQQIVVYRRLELSLDDVAALLDGDVDATEQLHRQRAAVIARQHELEELKEAIDHALERTVHRRPATPDELRELFGEAFDDDHRSEAQARWGATDAWRQSSARTGSYTKADWATIKAEMDAINVDFAAAKRRGVPADGSEAMDIAERARRHIDSRFYDCPPEFHVKLGEMYLADPRFRATYDGLEPGLAGYVRDAIVANSARWRA